MNRWSGGFEVFAPAVAMLFEIDAPLRSFAVPFLFSRFRLHRHFPSTLFPSYIIVLFRFQPFISVVFWDRNESNSLFASISPPLFDRMASNISNSRRNPSAERGQCRENWDCVYDSLLPCWHDLKQERTGEYNAVVPNLLWSEPSDLLIDTTRSCLFRH